MTIGVVAWEENRAWAKWIFGYLFDCVHRHTTWPQRARAGFDYVCCLDCGQEFAYSSQSMCMVSKEEQLKDRSQSRWGPRGWWIARRTYKYEASAPPIN
jgi:hypothetical protein